MIFNENELQEIFTVTVDLYNIQHLQSWLCYMLSLLGVCDSDGVILSVRGSLESVLLLQWQALGVSDDADVVLSLLQERVCSHRVISLLELIKLCKNEKKC